MAARLREYYKETVFNALKDKFKYSSVMQIPKLEKVVINMGLGKFLRDGSKDDMERITKDFTDILYPPEIGENMLNISPSFKILSSLS